MRVLCSECKTALGIPDAVPIVRILCITCNCHVTCRQSPALAWGSGRSVFQEVGGFDPTFPVNYNDVDLCLKVASSGYRVMVDPRVELTHLECGTREGGTTLAERQHFRERWGQILQRATPTIRRHSTVPRKSASPFAKVQSVPIHSASSRMLAWAATRSRAACSATTAPPSSRERQACVARSDADAGGYNSAHPPALEVVSKLGISGEQRNERNAVSHRW